MLKDVDTIRRCAEDAYQLYVERIGKPPAPMVDDFLSRVIARDVRVAEYQNRFAGFAIYAQKGHVLFLENIAVSPSQQKQGIGTGIMQYLERLASRAGLEAIELYTNAKMVENLTLYRELGYEITDTRVEDGFERVYFRKNRFKR